MSQGRQAKKRRQRERERAQEQRRTVRNWLIGLAVAGGIFAVVVLGIIAGSGGGGSGSNSGSSSAGGLAPEFRIKTTTWSGGEEFVLSQFRGKPVAVYAVASWCFTCISEAQAWGKITRELGDKVAVLIASVDPNDNENSFRQFREVSEGPERFWAVDNSGLLVQALNIRSLDTTVLIDQQGKIAFRDAVPTSEGKLRGELGKLLEVEAGAAARELPGTVYPDQGQEHLAPGETFDGYNSNPATSGPHDPQPVAWGFYDAPVAREKLVHNLEHGGRLILYNCPDGCLELVKQLQQFAERYVGAQQKVVVAPYPGMERKIALVSWTYLDLLDELDPNRVAEFIAAENLPKTNEADVPFR